MKRAGKGGGYDMEGHWRGSTIPPNMPPRLADGMDSSSSSSTSSSKQQPMIGAPAIDQEPSNSTALLLSQVSPSAHKTLTNPTQTTTPSSTPWNDLRYQPLPTKQQEEKPQEAKPDSSYNTTTTTTTPKAGQAVSHAPALEPPCQTPPLTPEGLGTEKGVGRRTTLVTPETFHATLLGEGDTQRQPPQQMPYVIAEPIADALLHSPPSPGEIGKCIVIMMCM
jgi:hypothetical protein